MGPNVRALIIRKMAVDAIPEGKGRKGATDAVFELMSNGAKISAGFRESHEWVKKAIAAVKAAPDNPYGDDDEAIAGAVLDGIKQRYRIDPPGFR